jgi:hypothetical protein
MNKLLPLAVIAGAAVVGTRGRRSCMWGEEPDYCDELNALEHRLSSMLRRIRPGADWADGAWHIRGDAYLTWDGEGWYIVRADSDDDGMIFGGEHLLCDAEDLDTVHSWIDAGMPIPDLTAPVRRAQRARLK